ncbi:MAG: uroporphyrinogen-III C-methyltransferase [Bacteroidota bacterium]
MPDNLHTGKVIIAGAGSGDPELITVKAARYLQQADVVLTDRLVSEIILKDYVRPDAEVICVGKQYDKSGSTPQQDINQLMIHYASQGKLIVRLKGGDVTIFSNILDELQTLVDHHIPYEIVPGVTAALGAAAYAGIPLTARGYAVSVRFLTYYKSDIVTDEYWKELANTHDTLVLYMSSSTLDTVVEKLISHGIGSDKQIAVVEQATTPLQQVYTAPVHEYSQTLANRSFLSPSLVIIGKVVELHRQFAWFQNENNDTEQYYFKPIENTRQSR